MIKGVRDGVEVEISEKELDQPGPWHWPVVTTKENLVDRMLPAELSKFTAARSTWPLGDAEKLHSLTQASEGSPAWKLLESKLLALFPPGRVKQILGTAEPELTAKGKAKSKI